MSIGKVNGKTVDVHIWSPIEEVESQALDQLKNIASLPWVFHHVAAMADVHLGIGATVGSVIAMKGAVSPAAVGVDIGCGMGAVMTNIKASDLSDDLSTIRSEIERQVPVGFAAHVGFYKPRQLSRKNRLIQLFSHFKELDVGVKDIEGRAMSQIGTLGGGNHFIELCLDNEENVWLTLHSGSRNIGKTLAEIHMARAQKLIHNVGIPDKALAAFLSETPEMAAYMRDLKWAQEYAFVNREMMLEIYEDIITRAFPKRDVQFDIPILCHHNYVSEETHFGEDVIVTRKGAISAKVGEMGLIPGSMGTRSYVVRGLGNPESFTSASHGAGRRMSRGAAKRTFTVEDLAKATRGVECRKDVGVLDEIPGAYKDIDRVMENQKDLVEVVAVLKQVLCVKG